jgi:hypothetical protein
LVAGRPRRRAETLNEALVPAGGGYPVTLMLDATALNGTPTPPVERRICATGAW